MAVFAADRTFVPAAFIGRLAHMPSRDAKPVVRTKWLTGQLADLTGPTVLGTNHGLEALRLATQVHRELCALSMNESPKGGAA